MGSNAIRFTGLSSGMDTETIVKTLLTNHQSKVDNEKNKQTLLDWRKEAWKEMNTKISTFNTKYTDKLRLAGSYATTKATISNENAISIASAGTMPEGVHKIENITLAKSAYVNSTDKIQFPAISASTTLSDLGVVGSTTININGIDVTLDSTDTLEDVKAEFAAANADLKVGTDGTLKITNNEGTTQETINYVSGDSELFKKLGFGSGSSIKIGKDGLSPLTGDSLSTRLSLLGLNKNDTIILNGKTITVEVGESMASLVGKMQQQVGSDLNINFDSINQKMFISSKKAGVNITIGGTALDELKLTGPPVDGNQASCTYNGVEIKGDSNVITVNGFTITLKQEASDPVYVSATKDTEGTVKLFKEFIDEYNKLIEDINTKLDTKKSRTYQPLTEEQKESMTDKEIEQWEDKIKESLFYRDSGLTEVRDVLRDGLAGVVNNSNNSYKVLSDIGITTGKWQDKGKLVLDETKLLKALQEKPDEVISLLTGSGSEAEAKKAYQKANNITDAAIDASYTSLSAEQKKTWLTSTRGIFSRISTEFTSLSKSTDLKSYGSFYNDKLDTEEGRAIAKNILKYQDRYDKAEKMYYAKFTAMEKAMSQINAQSSALTNMLGQA
ncbi:MAG: flagellar hook-associated 2 protein [Anaerocolumna sp.]|jgi:flagellar hook-associated protein 2|nr:flagellar hook-associated 2 protein [Anaerocolumna sp.]